MALQVEKLELKLHFITFFSLDGLISSGRIKGKRKILGLNFYL